MFKPSLALLALLASVTSAQADTITQWNFNSNPADSSTTTGSLVSNLGTGTAATVGGVSSAFGSGSGNGGSSDPVTTDDTGWQTSGYAAQGSGNKTTGVQFNISTVGFENLSFSYDLRHSNTSSAYEQVQYSLNGSSFVDLASFSGFAGDTWFNGRSVDLSSIAGAANNANFALRVVSAYAPSTSNYAVSTTGSNYAGTGTWRFDMVTLNGTQIAAVPEGDGLVLAMSGLLGLAALRRRKSS